MAAPTINFAGFVYDDAGDAVSGATIHIYDKNSTSTAREASSVTTNSDGYYTYAHATPGEFDVEIVKGTSKRRYKFDDKIHLSEIDVEKLSIRGNEGAIAGLYIYADEGDDVSDQWLIDVGTDGVLAFGNDAASQGTFADQVIITPNSTLASSSMTIHGILDVNGSVDWDVTDVQVDSSGDIDLVSTNDAAAAIYLRENAGTSGTIKIHADQGTSVTEGAESVNILSDAGGVGIRSTANLAKAVNITSDGGTTGSIAIFNDQGTSVTEGAESISLLSDAGGVGIRSTANLANAVNITVDGGTTSSMTLFNDTGTTATEGSASIQLLSDVGGINVKSGLDGANAILLTADGGTSETIEIHADQGTGAASISAVSDVGGITLDAGLDIVLSADGGNVTMDDGTSTIFDFDVDGTTLTIHDDQDTGDTAVITMAQHGALSIVTTDDDAAAANIQITADGTVDIDSAGVLTLDSGAAINIEPAGGSAVLIDGTISIDGGAITGVASILQADVKIGEDDETKIDFETADEIHLYAANVEQVYVADNIFGPQSDSDVDLGTTGVRWKDFFVDSITVTDDIAVDGTSNLDNTDIDGTLAVDGTTISLDATTSFNIDNSNTSNGITIATATSGVPISIGHATSETTVNDNLSVTGDIAVDGTANLDAVDIDGAVNIDGDLTFNGAQTITTSSGSLTLDTAGAILQEVGGVSKQQIGTLTTTGGYVGSVVTQQGEDATAVRNMSARYVIDLGDSITSAVTVATLTPSATASKWYRSYIRIVCCAGATGERGEGAVLDRIFYMEVTGDGGGSLAVGTSVSGTEDAFAPAVTITTSGTTSLLQVASENATGGLTGGLMIFELYHSPGSGNATIAVT